MSWRWWYQEGIDLKAAKERAAEAIAKDSKSESDLESEAESEAESEEGWLNISASSEVSGSSEAEWGGVEPSVVKTPGERKAIPTEPAHRGTESAASQCIAQPYSASL